MKLRKQLTVYKYSDDFIQIYPDIATIDHLKDILQLTQLVIERQETTFDGTPDSRNLIFSDTIKDVIYVEVNGIIQLPNSYTISDNVITYNSNLNTADIVSSTITIETTI